MYLIIATLTISFVLNFLWENLHSKLYVYHMGEEITQRVLFIATLGDVLILSVFALVWYFVPFFKKNFWVFVPIALFVAYLIEKCAFMTNRWQYAEAMPIVPILNVGLSPFLQLAVTTMVLMFILKLIQKKFLVI